MDFSSSSKEAREWFYSKALLQTANLHQLLASGDYPTLDKIIPDILLFSVVITLFRVAVDYFFLDSFMRRSLSAFKPRKLPFQNPKLEVIYQKNKFLFPDINKIKSVSQELNLPVEDVRKWIRVKQAQDRFNVKLRRSKECVVRFVAYSITSLYAWIVVSQEKNQIYAANPENSLLDIFKAPPTDLEVSFFSKLQFPLYLHLTLFHVLDIARNGFKKDFLEMLVHHLLVLVVLSNALFGNFLFITTFALFLHDFTDLFLESSRLLNYLGWVNLSAFAVMSLNAAWGYLRLYVFCKKVYLPIFFPDLIGIEKRNQVQKVFGNMKQSLFWTVTVIVALNVFWFVMISRIAFKAMWSGVDEKKRERAMTDLSTDDDKSEIETESEVGFEDEDEFSEEESKKKK